MPKTTPTVWDVAVVGGGRAGAAAARVLAAGGCHTLLIDRPGRRRIGESLVPVARTLLGELGVWETFQRDGHLASYGNESLWGSSQIHSTDFIRTPYGHGWHIDGTRFDDTLRAGAAAAGATVWTDTVFRRLERAGADGWRLELVRSTGPDNSVRCRFVIDATGRSYRVAHALGVRRRYCDRLLAFQARFCSDPERGDGDQDQDSLSFVEAVAEGWWYTARMPSRDGVQRVAVFFTDIGTRSVRSAATANGFLRLLENAPGVLAKLACHDYTLTAGPLAVDARSSCLERLHGDGWLAVGDAAMAFDPLSAQGILNALYSGAKAGKAVLAHLAGDTIALDNLADDLVGVYRHFQISKERYYQMERRWPDSDFWQARLGASQIGREHNQERAHATD